MGPGKGGIQAQPSLSRGLPAPSPGPGVDAGPRPSWPERGLGSKIFFFRVLPCSRPGPSPLPEGDRTVRRRAMHLPSQGTRIVAVSNRLPVVAERVGDRWKIRSGSGGLVTALAPVLRHRGGLWIGWAGTVESQGPPPRFLSTSKKVGYTLIPVSISEEDLEGFYLGFANQVVWPLFHDFQDRCNFDPAFWYCYLDVNRRFAKVIQDQTLPDDYVWVHDYHLIHVAHFLKELGCPRKTGFFLHIPFPPPDLFLKLPWRNQVLRALLEFDLLGFQTVRDRRNFLLCLAQLCPDVKARGRGQVVSVHAGAREVRVGSFPISIDFEAFAQRAASREVADRAWFFHENYPEQQIILGVDRLDYTKGIPQRLQAFRLALEKHPELRGKTTLIQVVVPSRSEVPQYQELKAEIERLVGEINGEFTREGWVPIQYLYRHLDPVELLAYYRASEIALITPLKDGMNLVAKEFCAANIDGKGVLILSEFAGAAAQLHRGALMVNPYDREGVAEAIFRAYTMDRQERKSRMQKLREKIRKQNIFWWVDSFLLAALSRQLVDFPPLEDYVPMFRLEEEEETREFLGEAQA